MENGEVDCIATPGCYLFHLFVVVLREAEGRGGFVGRVCGAEEEEEEVGCTWMFAFDVILWMLHRVL